jgi:trigger factor
MRFRHHILCAILLAGTSHALLPHTTSRSPAFVGLSGSSWSSVALQASTLERLPDSSVKVKLEIPGSATRAAYEKVCNEVSKSITIPGFRKGSRIPPQVLEQAMAAKGGRNAMRVQAINELLAELIEPALKEEHGLEPIGQPKLETPAEEIASDFEPGKDFLLSIQCDVWPDIEWKAIEGKEKPYLGLKGSYKRKPFNKGKFDKAMNDLKERYATLEAIEDKDHALQMGDACLVNMEGYMATDDGEKGDKLPDAASGDRVEVILGKGRYMTGLVEGLIGAKVGDTKTVYVTFPMVGHDF